MILGHGDIASVLAPYDKKWTLFFASGVSNSQETRDSEYQREIELLNNYALQGWHIVYFSSMSVFYSNSRYAIHKKAMEWRVKALFPHYTIIRLGNITWGTNPHTIINFFKGQKERGETPVLQDTYRYIVTLEEFLYWIGMIPGFSCEMNIPGERMTVKEVWERYVEC